MPNMSLEKVKMPEQEPQVRNQNFQEVALGYTEEQAMEEATRCLNCRHSPCKNGCPVGVPIPEFISEVAKGHFEDWLLCNNHAEAWFSLARNYCFDLPICH